VFLGIVIGMLSDTVMEALQAGYSKRVMEVRLRRREAGKRRKRKLRYRKALEGYIRAKGAPIWIAADGRAAPRAPSDSTNPVHTAWNAISGRNTTGAGRGSGRSPFRLNTAVLSRAEIDAAAREADMPVVTYPGRARSRSRSRDRSTPEQIIERQASEDSENAIVLRSLDEYKDVLEAEKTKQFLVRVSPPFHLSRTIFSPLPIQFSMAWISFILFWIIGSLIFMKTEGWTYGVAMYFCA
jgi:potassium channel subfamily K